MLRRIRNRQFRTPQVLALEIDGSAVDTTSGRDGLLTGKFCATVKKGTGADSNLVTIDFDTRLFGKAPAVKFQPITLQCVCRLDGAPSRTQVKIRTLQLDGSTKADDADFVVFLFSSEYGEAIEGWHA